MRAVKVSLINSQIITNYMVLHTQSYIGHIHEKFPVIITYAISIVVFHIHIEYVRGRRRHRNRIVRMYCYPSSKVTASHLSNS